MNYINPNISLQLIYTYRIKWLEDLKKLKTMYFGKEIVRYVTWQELCEHGIPLFSDEELEKSGIDTRYYRLEQVKAILYVAPIFEV